jgi:hypothetical protein
MKQCPCCGGTKFSIEIASFWAEADQDGNMVGDWADYEDSTEPSGLMMCHECDSEFDIGECSEND